MSEPVGAAPAAPPNPVADIESKLDAIDGLLGQLVRATEGLATQVGKLASAPPPAILPQPAVSSGNPTVDSILNGLSTALALYSEIHAATAKK